MWIPMFFWAKMTTLAVFAALAVWIFTLLNIALFVNVNSIAGYILIPYLLWISIILYMNAYVAWHNPDPFF